MPTKVVMVPGFELKIEHEATPEIEHITSEVVDKAEANYARHVVTGRTLQSVRQEGTRVYVGGAWAFLEYGTRPHVIQAQGKKVLANNGRIFGKKVNHPGNRPFAPLVRALESGDDFVSLTG